MARIRSRVQVESARINIERPPSIGPAVSQLAGQVQQFAGERLESKRLEQAKLAAEAVTFERDGQGRIMAPNVPLGRDGNPVPSIYDEAFTQQLMTRYGQRLEQEGRKTFQELALQNRNNPAAFDAAADAYRKSINEVAHPFIKGKIDDQLLTLQVAHSNHLARNREQWEYQRNYDTFVATLESRLSDLSSVIANTTDDLQIQLNVESLYAVYDKAIEDQLITGGDREALDKQVMLTMSRAAVARMVDGLPATDTAETNMINQLTKIIEGKGELPVFDPQKGRIVMMDAETAIPNELERQSVVQGVREYLSARKTARNQWIDATNIAHTNQILVRELPLMWQARDEKSFYKVDPLLEILALNPMNEQLQSRISGLVSVMEAHNADVLTRRDTDSQINYLTLGMNQQFEAQTPEIQAVVNSAMKAATGADAVAWGDTSIDIGIDDPVRRFRTYSQLMNMMMPDKETGTIPAHMKEFINATAQLQARYEDFDRRWIANEGPLEDMDEAKRSRYYRERSRAIPGMVLNQSPKMAQYVDDFMRAPDNPSRWSEATWWELGAPDQQVELQRRLNDIRHLGIVPKTLQDFANDVLGNLDKYAAEGRDFTQLLDIAEFLFNDPRMASKALTAFGERQTKAMNAALDLAGPGLKQQVTEQMMKLMNKAMLGENVFLSMRDMEPEDRQRIRDMMQDKFVDDIVEWAPYKDDEISIITNGFFNRGDPIAVPKELEDRWLQLATAYSNIFNMSTDRGRGQAIAAAYQDIKNEGWGTTEYQLTSEIPGYDWFNPLPPRFTGTRLQNRVAFNWAQQTIEDHIPDSGHRKAAMKGVEQQIAESETWRIYGGTARPKVRQNISLHGVGPQLSENGVYEYAWVAFVLTENGNMVPVNDDGGVNNNKLFFFSDYIDTVEQQRARSEAEWKKNLSIHQEGVIDSIDNFWLRERYIKAAPPKDLSGG